jgi:hypothetical protein
MAKKGRKDTAQADIKAQIGTSTDKKEIMQAVLKMSLTGGSFLDTKFYAFSRKRSTGIVDEPRPVYANSALLRASSKYFDGCKQSHFRYLLTLTGLYKFSREVSMRLKSLLCEGNFLRKSLLSPRNMITILTVI